MLRTCPITLEAAKEFVGKLHRHHKPPLGHKFSIGACDEDGRMVGAVTVSMPKPRGADTGLTAEANRLTTDGTPNACSLLYGAAARAAEAMGFTKIITYIRVDESGDSLKASGWEPEAEVKGRSWSRPSRPRSDKTEIVDRLRWAKVLHPSRRRKR